MTPHGHDQERHRRQGSAGRAARRRSRCRDGRGRATSLRTPSSPTLRDGARGDDREPRPEPLRLGARHARAGTGDPRGRDAHEPQRLGLRRTRKGAHRPTPIGAPNLTISGCAASHDVGRDVRRRARGHRRRHARRPWPDRGREEEAGSDASRQRRPRPFAAAPTPSTSRSPSTTRRSAPRQRTAAVGRPPRRRPAGAVDPDAQPRRPRTRRRSRPEGQEGREPRPGIGDAMKPSDRTIMIGLLVVGAFAAFWFLALSPKRDKASELEDKISELKPTSPRRSRSWPPGSRPRPTISATSPPSSSLARPRPPTAIRRRFFEQLVDVIRRLKTDFQLLQLGAARRGGTPAAPRRGRPRPKARKLRPAEERGRPRRHRQRPPPRQRPRPFRSAPPSARPGSAGPALRHDVQRRLLPDRRPLQGDRPAGRVQERRRGRRRPADHCQRLHDDQGGRRPARSRSSSPSPRTSCPTPRASRQERLDDAA